MDLTKVSLNSFELAVLWPLKESGKAEAEWSLRTWLTQLGNETGTQSGNEAGTQPGNETETQSGNEAETQPGTQPGTGNEAGYSANCKSTSPPCWECWLQRQTSSLMAGEEIRKKMEIYIHSQGELRHSLIPRLLFAAEGMPFGNQTNTCLRTYNTTTHMHAHIHTHMHTNTLVHTHTHIHPHTHVHTHIS